MICGRVSGFGEHGKITNGGSIRRPAGIFGTRRHRQMASGDIRQGKASRKRSGCRYFYWNINRGCIIITRQVSFYWMVQTSRISWTKMKRRDLSRGTIFFGDLMWKESKAIHPTFLRILLCLLGDQYAALSLSRREAGSSDYKNFQATRPEYAAFYPPWIVGRECLGIISGERAGQLEKLINRFQSDHRTCVEERAIEGRQCAVLLPAANQHARRGGMRSRDWFPTLEKFLQGKVRHQWAGR